MQTLSTLESSRLRIFMLNKLQAPLVMLPPTALPQDGFLGAVGPLSKSLEGTKEVTLPVVTHIVSLCLSHLTPFTVVLYLCPVVISVKWVLNFCVSMSPFYCVCLCVVAEGCLSVIRIQLGL